MLRKAWAYMVPPRRVTLSCGGWCGLAIGTELQRRPRASEDLSSARARASLPYLARGPNPANFTPRVTQIRSAPRIEIEMPAERPEIPWERLSQTQVPSVCPDAIFSSSARFADPLFGLQRVMTSVRLLTHGRTRSEHKRQR